MSAKPVFVLLQAETDIGEALDWYAGEGGPASSDRWLQAVRATLRHIGEHPRIGASRYATVLNLPGLRFQQVEGFPYLAFYIEHRQRIDVGRVLHEKRDIPAWLGGDA